MKRPRWLADSLGLRLFLLMWAALVFSHVAAYVAVHALHAPPGPMSEAPVGKALPTFPSLPPTPGMAPEPNSHGAPPLPADALALDYGVRLLIIALAAWWGSSWLARPVSKLVNAAQALGPALAQGRQPVMLEETRGTREVRLAASVFNRMAAQIRQTFEARGLMMAAISHDLRTPLTRMRMRLEKTGLDVELRQRSVSDIDEMNALIDAVLDVFRPHDAARETWQRTDLLALLQALVDDQTEHGARVTLQTSAALPIVVRTDALALRRVVGNLVANALRYAGQADLNLATREHHIHITIDDEGPGIPLEKLQQVLEPFVRLESSRNRQTGGAGLGLFIARELTQSLGATLTLSNRPAGGLRAEVVLAAEA